MEKTFYDLYTEWKLDIKLPERSKIKKVRAENNLKAKMKYKKL